jgi:hypothetical protein
VANGQRAKETTPPTNARDHEGAAAGTVNKGLALTTLW